MSPRLPPRLVALSPGDLAERGTRRFLEDLRKAVAAGVRGVLVREPPMLDGALLDLARSVRSILPPDGWLGVHDRVHLAGACGAQAVHLGFRSLSPAEARSVLADEIAIGFSAHEGDERERWHGADYLFFGPVLDTPSKRGLKSPVGFDGLAAAVEQSPVPVWAIGGLKPEHVRACLDAGCAGLAVLSGLPESSRYLRELGRIGSPR